MDFSLTMTMVAGRDAELYRVCVGRVRSGGRDDAQSRAGYGREMADWTA